MIGRLGNLRLQSLMLCVLCISLMLIPPTSDSIANELPQRYSYQVIREYIHDPEAFTQGLAYDQGSVYEGTGLFGKSSLRRVDLSTGRIEQFYEYEKEIFAEGVAVFKDRIFQLTWKNNLIFEYNKIDFSLLRTWPYSRQGWGVTHDGENLIVSDGSTSLYFLNPVTMEERRVIMVHDHTGPVRRLNELEYVKGLVYANIYQQDRIAIIDPDNGVVSGYLELSGLSEQVKKDEKIGVLNGIMYDSVNDRLFVTGKLWPYLFEIKLVPIVSGDPSKRRSGN